jgi:hypothetical protein
MPKLDPADSNSAATAVAPLPATPVPAFGSTPLGNNSASTTPPAFGTPASNFSSSFGASSSAMTQTNNYSGTGQANSNLASTGGAMQEGGTSAIETSHGFGNFINSKWRPMMAVIYMITCTTDFVVFPILWSLLQAVFHGSVTSQWAPLTLQGAGLYHIAMGAVLGLAAYGRSQEKIAGKA